MIINPIIPIWLMLIITVLIILILVKYKRKEKLEMYIKIGIIVLMFIINLRPMVPNGENTAISSNVNVLFVVDKSVSMKALDYDGNKERMKGVSETCCKIVNELENCKFSLMTFGNYTKRVLPFTNDLETVTSELNAITVEDDSTALGSSMNIVKTPLEEILKNKKDEKTQYVVFFISDR